MEKPVEFVYVGGELGLFAHALNWKSYWAGLLEPYLRGEVIEVGAGLGANTRLLRSPEQRRWVCLEPDRQLLGQMEADFARQPPRGTCEFRGGTLAEVPEQEQFDTILYLDVLEHIEDDAGELRRAVARLKPGGHLVVLSPAHGWLFSKFDAVIGHHRRYTRKTLQAALPERAPARIAYLDSCGLFASLGNRLLLRQKMPTLKQILFWDRFLVPLSRRLDPWLGFKAGKSILGVWRQSD